MRRRRKRDAPQPQSVTTTNPDDSNDAGACDVTFDLVHS
ncbi:hypothetical protein BPA30113_03025 [Burkholderia paludis]|uniref:Uncharacterized protein n=1 Tax=Burkholderia paludis TaxID=1506587 RepID=A0A6J5DHR4_9BURK|nr:hypothetical protein LMG30113_01979 [Burkholderia paludis]VWB67498.1 hypothetical protein BPA30113_03025 [Burkholderia paludis]